MDTKGRLVQLASGDVVERDVLNIVSKIAELWPTLVVKYLNPDYQAGLTDAPYAIFEKCPDGIERMVLSAMTLDDRILERIYAADTSKHQILSRITDNNDLFRAKQKQQFRENTGEIKDIIKHMIDSSKGRYSFTTDGKRIEVDDDPKSQAKVKVLE